MRSVRFRGEAADIDLHALTAWQDSVLRDALARFRPADIFNVDETALFWELLLSKTLAFRGTLFITMLG
jgi:hypothetical protein